MQLYTEQRQLNIYCLINSATNVLYTIIISNYFVIFNEAMIELSVGSLKKATGIFAPGFELMKIRFV